MSMRPVLLTANQLHISGANPALGCVYAVRGELDSYPAELTAYSCGDLVLGIGPVLALRLSADAAAELARRLTEATTQIKGGAQ